MTALAPERRRIGLVFQDHALFPHRSVEQNIAFGLKHLDRRSRGRRVAEVLDLVRLPGRQALPARVVGGEQQRIALARALAPDPAIVLLDEPFASLDSTLRDDVRRDVVAALRARDAAAVLVTHDREEALALGDRVAVMSAGRVLQIGRPDDVYERPVDRFVADFLGEASFLPHGEGYLIARPTIWPWPPVDPTSWSPAGTWAPRGATGSGGPMASTSRSTRPALPGSNRSTSVPSAR